MSLNFAQSFDLINDMLDFKIKHTIVLAGPYGLGKSTCFNRVAQKRGIPFVDKRLSLCDVSDLKGMFKLVNGRTMFAPPDDMPLAMTDRLKMLLTTDEMSNIITAPAGILCFDEMDRAVREVQNAAFEAVLDRRIDGNPIMPGWVIGAGINADADVYQTIDMDVSFIDRLVYVKFAPTQEEWFGFAREGGVHDAVIAFLASYPNFMDPKKDYILSHPGEKLFSRRSWERFSIYLNQYTEKQTLIGSGINLLDGTPKSTAKLNAYAEMYVGDEAAGVFGKYVSAQYRTINADAILNKWDAKLVSDIQKTIDDPTQATVLAGVSRLVSDYVIEKQITQLTDAQSKNLADFLCMLPSENAGNFWRQFNFKCKVVSNKWFAGPDRERIAEKIKSSWQNPKSGKGAKA